MQTLCKGRARGVPRKPLLVTQHHSVLQRGLGGLNNL